MRRLLQAVLAAAVGLAAVVLPIDGSSAETSEDCAIRMRGLDGSDEYSPSNCTLTADRVAGPAEGFTAEITGTGWVPLSPAVELYQCGEEECSDRLAALPIAADGSFAGPVTLTRTITTTLADGSTRTTDCPPDLCQLQAFVDSPDGSLAQVAVLAIAFAVPAVTVDPATLEFGSQTVGAPSAARTITITNTGEAALHIGGNGSFGDTDDFSVVEEGCAFTTVEVGQSCAVSVVFTPTTEGERGAWLTYNDNTVEGGRTIGLSGVGMAPAADLAVALSATPNPVKSGGTVTYTLSARNDGTSDASNVRLANVLPSAAQFSSMTTDGSWSCTTPPKGSTGTISCTRAAMASGATSTLTITAGVVSSGKSTITDSASITSEVADPDPSDNQASVTTSVSGRR